jgi:hypothetical protein
MNAGTRGDSPTRWPQAGVVLMILVGLAGCAGGSAREPTIPAADYRAIVAFLGEQGYDTSKNQKVPQQRD